VAADEDDEAGLLGGGDEVARRDDPELGMPPPRKCLDADHLPAGQGHLRLVMGHELPAGCRATKIVNQSGLGDRRHIIWCTSRLNLT
jgi:hypothetical protein